MVDISSIPPGPWGPSSADALLKFRLWRMVRDIWDHLHSSGDEDCVVLRWRDESRSHRIEQLARRYASGLDEGDVDAEGFVDHFVSCVVPAAIRRCFEGGGTPPRTPSSEEDALADDADVEDLLSDLLVKEQLWFDELPTDVLEPAIEGWLRLELIAADVDDVLCSGYDVRFSARAFAAWFVRDVMPLV